ncbi:SusC/RagA family TonB-linked outer membrane protein [Barnesiella intestinihominis]|uniref:SusC/RagA family TonB-linked outer membrane protein n=1 Tax=Barnesiella intestinihominis TaxID=487174 RepID=UPI003A92D981
MLSWKNLFGMYGRGHFCNKLKRSILLLFLLGMFPYVWGQQTNVSLNLRNVPIKSVLSQIEKSTNYYVFFYTDNLNSELSKRVNVTVNNTPVVTVLNQIFSTTNISYEIKNKRQVSLFLVEKSSPKSKAQAVKSNKIQIAGTVFDANNEPLIGASVRVLGTTIGSMADMNGAFKLEVSSGDVLEASYIGYNPQQVKVGSQTRFQFVLEEVANTLDDIVVVGYSSQKKETVTGSISMVTTKDLLQSPQANISNALGGRIPGLLSVQRSGEPGQDMSTLRIRGVGTFASDAESQNPLIMVDGIEVNNLNDIDPNEVESLSILKDASATAVYGVRGANGVILITTKRGELGKPKISFSTNVAITNFPFLPEPMNSYEYARAYNEAQAYDYYSQLSYIPRYSEEAIEAYRTGSDPLFYPDINWYDYMLKDFSTQTQTNFNVSGGTERVKYFVSLGVFTQNGMLDTGIYDPGYSYQIAFRRYNMRSNFDINVTKNLLLSLDISNQMGNLQNPNWSTGQIMESLNSTPSNAAPGVIDNKVVTITDVFGSGRNPASPYTRGWKSKYENNLNLSGRFTYKMDYLLKGLSLRGALSYKSYSTETKTYNDRGITYDLRRAGDELIFVPSTDPGKLTYQGTNSRNIRIYSEIGAEYTGKFGEHTVTGLVLYNQGKYYNPTLKYNIPNGYQGLVGRVTYNYGNRYLAEVNVGYNGTENFAPGKRFGWFPAYSLGWVLTEEPYFPRNEVLSFLKIRGSYGTVGNDKIGGDRFLYLPSVYTYTGSNSYYFGEVGSSYVGYVGSNESKAGNPDLTWEKAIKWNVGADVKFWGDRIGLTFDYFMEHRDNILCNRNTVPTIIGISASNLPAYNMGRMRNSGWDGEISVGDHIGDWSYFVKANFTYAHNKILEQDEVIRNEDYLYRTGLRYGQFFGYVADGIFNSWEEVNAAGRPEYVMANNNNKIQPGDVRYVDINGDGKINDDDQVPIGYSNFPEIMYGISLGGSYKNLDISLLFQGATHVSNMPSRRIMRGFYEYTGANRDLLKSWSYERFVNNQKIVYPRYGVNGVGHNYLTSTYWLEDASYLRLKNVEVGYTFRQESLKKAGIGSIRIYVNGSNLLTWTDMLPGQDPEVANAGVTNSEPYPVTRVFNFGLNVNF